MMKDKKKLMKKIIATMSTVTFGAGLVNISDSVVDNIPLISLLTTQSVQAKNIEIYTAYGTDKLRREYKVDSESIAFDGTYLYMDMNMCIFGGLQADYELAVNRTLNGRIGFRLVDGKLMRILFIYDNCLGPESEATWLEQKYYERSQKKKLLDSPKIIPAKSFDNKYKLIHQSESKSWYIKESDISFDGTYLYANVLMYDYWSVLYTQTRIGFRHVDGKLKCNVPFVDANGHPLDENQPDKYVEIDAFLFMPIIYEWLDNNGYAEDLKRCEQDI